MDETTLPPDSISTSTAGSGGGEAPALVVIWSRHEPARVGEVLLFPDHSDSPWTFGRGEPTPEERSQRIGLVRQRPGVVEPTGPLTCPRISRAQLRISGNGRGGLIVENTGRCPLVCDGKEVSRAEFQPGAILELRNELLFFFTRRLRELPALAPGHSTPLHPFGEADVFGLVGESPALWELRHRIAALARLEVHVLVLGPSGSGKEVVAQAIHAQSPRGRKTIVARNAATLPEGLVDAELFGNVRNYPNPGTVERAGLIGQADGSTLFLDEFAELPASLQAHLLRVLDGGEYQRLGDASSRRANFRLIAATNRPADALKFDILARLKARIVVPDLDARREDIPFLVMHLLRRHAAGDSTARMRFFPEGDVKAAPRVSPALMRALVQHRYTTQIRELDALLLSAVLGGHRKYVDLTEAVRSELAVSVAAPLEEEPFNSEETRRLTILRKHRFNATACGRDAEYGGNRQTADLHVRQMICKALPAAAWNPGRAARLLSGSGDEDLTGRVRGRIETFLSNLRRRLENSEDDEALRRALAEEWKGSAEAALRVLEALQKGRIGGDDAADERAAEKA